MSFSIKHPDYKSLQFAELIPVEFNQIDVDRMMTTIIEMTLRQGRTMRSKTETQEFDRYLQNLVNNRNVIGLNENERKQVLDGWLRSTVVKMGKLGLDRKISQMDFIRPLTIGIYRSGLPRTLNRNRKADVLVYSAILSEGLRRNESKSAGVRKGISELVRNSLGKEINLGTGPLDLPEYDEESSIDMSALLTMRFLSGFEEMSTLNPERVADEGSGGPTPGSTSGIGKDFFGLLDVYGNVLSAQETIEHIAALVSVRLFQFPLRVAIATKNLLETGELSGDFIDSDTVNPLSIYCDFTRNSGSASYELSKLSVQNDLGLLRSFFGDRLILRSLVKALDFIEDIQDEVKNSGPVERMKLAAGLKSSREMQREITRQIQEIYLDLEVDGEGRKYIDSLKNMKDAEGNALAPDSILKNVLFEGLRRRGLEMQVLWYWSTGGINKSYGLLQGSFSNRSSWRYSPSDELLTALLLTCFTSENGAVTDSELEMSELISRLKVRYGIFITDPPPFAVGSAIAGQACSQNRIAFVSKLQLLGCFENLSDDFSAQMVRRPRKANV
jgi:hypothetical protein